MELDQILREGEKLRDRCLVGNLSPEQLVIAQANYSNWLLNHANEIFEGLLELNEQGWEQWNAIQAVTNVLAGHRALQINHHGGAKEATRNLVESIEAIVNERDRYQKELENTHGD